MFQTDTATIIWRKERKLCEIMDDFSDIPQRNDTSYFTGQLKSMAMPTCKEKKWDPITRLGGKLKLFDNKHYYSCYR